MNLKHLCLFSLVLLIISRILLTFGFDFLQNQQPIDFAHWLMLIGTVLTFSFTFVFPKSIFNTIATVLTVLGIIAHVGMCTIDFVLWSFGDNHEGRNQLIGQLINTPSIWHPFMTIGPSLLYVGLATHAWKFIKSHPISAMTAIGGSAVIGLGQMIWQNMVIVVIGYVVFSVGLLMLVYKKS